jgi:DNA mismatch repair ATPase MutS
VLRHYEHLFRRMTDPPVESSMLRRLQSELRTSGGTAPHQLLRLRRIVEFADLRHVPLFHFPIHAVTLWDFHVLWFLERWQARSGQRMRAWFRALGEMEALGALAELSHDNPGWVFPRFDATGRALKTRDLGHPFLRDGIRVVNDVEVGPPGTCLLVTGSNMSGKSTLLKAIGVNVILAHAGGPVCATDMRLPPVALYTCIRVQDSLEEGVSYFMAGLRRLKLIVDAARSADARPASMLYLLDEVLQGTNTAERQVAVRVILRHLLSLPAIGVVTTHDLSLADEADLARACTAVHFSEGVEGAGDSVTLSFDYRLQPGLATSRNALRLLRMMGLGG